MISFSHVTSTQYRSLTPVADRIYYITDTGEQYLNGQIYKGADAIDCLCFEALEANSTIACVVGNGSSTPHALEYSTDRTTWTAYQFTGTAGQTITLAKVGRKVFFRGTNGKWSCNWHFSTGTGKLAVSGNPMSLADKSCTRTEMDSNEFGQLFLNNTALVDASGLNLPAPANGYCYEFMFYGCTSLTEAPELPATTLMSGCYSRMFAHCTSLTKAPELPATTLSGGCYYEMFIGCTSLVKAPELPATTLAASCYYSMFAGCASLVDAPHLPATTLAAACYAGMFKGCTSLRNISAATGNLGGYTNDWLTYYTYDNVQYNQPYNIVYQFPDGRTNLGTGTSGIAFGSIVTAEAPSDDYLCFTALNTIPDGGLIFRLMTGTPQTPVSLEYSYDKQAWTAVPSNDRIPATTAGTKVYVRGYNDTINTYTPGGAFWYYNFNTYNGVQFAVSGRINSLIDKTCRYKPRTNGCFFYLFREAGSPHGFADASGLVIPEVHDASYGVPTVGEHIYYGLFFGCANLTKAPKRLGTLMGDYIYAYIFYNCTSLTEAPELPATTPAASCYEGMFHSCTSLTEAPGLPATTLASSCYANMFLGCSKLKRLKVNFTSWGTNNTQYTAGWLQSACPEIVICKPQYLADVRGISNLPENATVVVGDWQPSDDCLCMTAREANTAIFLNNWASVSVEYSFDRQDWTAYAGKTVVLANAGNKVWWRGDNATFCSNNFDSPVAFGVTSGGIDVSGNAMSLLEKTCQQRYMPVHAFYCLFRKMGSGQGVVDASGLSLPATTLAHLCYACMFYNCTSLTETPVLPATTLAANCYTGMFYNCTSLTEAPELPATTLASSCYAAMFAGCTSLKRLKVGFSAWDGATGVTYNWLYDAPARGDFICPSGLDTTTTQDVSHVPEGWTVSNGSVTGNADTTCATSASSVAAYCVLPSSEVAVVTVASALTLNAASVAADKVAYAEIVLDIEAMATVVAGGNLTIVDAPLAGARNVCVVRWSGGTAKLYVTMTDDLPSDESSSSI